MTDARVQAVLSGLAEIHKRGSFILDLVDRMDGLAGGGDRVQIPDIGVLAVESTGAAVAGSANDATPNVLNLVVDKDPAIYIDIPKLQNMQTMGGRGNWAKQVSMQALLQYRNAMDASFLEYMATGAPTFSLTGDYTVNPAGDALSVVDYGDAIGILEDQDGSFLPNFAWVFGAGGAKSLRTLSTFQPNENSADGFLGIPRLGSLMGIPVYQTNSVKKRHSVATSAASIATNVATLTVAAGHGFVVGELATTSGLTANATTAVAISAVTATTIVLAITASDGAMGDGVGFVTSASERCMLIDRQFAHGAIQAMPEARIVEGKKTTTDELQISGAFGYVARPGRAVNLYCPPIGS